MSKVRDDLQQSVVGWFQPHVRPSWDGTFLDPATGEVKPDPRAVSMTKQSFKDECDINVIVRKFLATGEVEHVRDAARQGLYVDLPNALELQQGLDMIAQAEAGFMALPAQVRAAFDNNPVKFVDFATNPDPKNQQQLIDWGIAKDNRPPATPPQPDKTPEVKAKE